MGHARALLSLADEAEQRRIARDVIARSLSVRETESLVKKIVEGGAPAREAAPPQAGRRAHARGRGSAEAARSAPACASSASGTRGRIEIDFVSEEELIRIYEQLTDREG